MSDVPFQVTVVAFQVEKTAKEDGVIDKITVGVSMEEEKE